MSNSIILSQNPNAHSSAKDATCKTTIDSSDSKVFLRVKLPYILGFLTSNLNGFDLNGFHGVLPRSFLSTPIIDAHIATTFKRRHVLSTK